MSSNIVHVLEDIDRLAQRCASHVKHRFGFEPDFGIDTLSVLDHFVELVACEEARGQSPDPGDKVRSHMIHLFAPTIGAYFGEVVRKTFGARWRNTSSEPKKWFLEFEDFFLRFNPAGAAAEVIMKQQVEEWNGALQTSPSLIDALHERLAAAPPLPEDQFFTFVSRLEVLQIAGDYLMERAAKYGSVGCRREDYEEVFGL